MDASAMSPKSRRALQAAHGYHDLDMMEEAWHSLRSLTPAEREAAPALEIEVILWLKERNWTKGMEISQRLCESDPTACSGYIHQAYCLHELGQTAEARQTLLRGPKALREEAIYHYNMGCYQAQLGDLDDARRLLRRSFELDPKLSQTAKRDPDLAGLWATL